MKGHGQLDKQWFLSVNDCIVGFFFYNFLFFRGLSMCTEKHVIWTNICHQIFIFGQYNADIRPQILKKVHMISYLGIVVTKECLDTIGCLEDAGIDISVDWVLKAPLQSHLVSSQSSTMSLSILLMFVCTYSGTAGKIIEYQMYISRSKPAAEQPFPRNEYYK